MLLKDYLLVILVFGIIIAGSAYMVGDLANYYEVDVDTSFNSTYGTITDIGETTESLRGTIGAENSISAGGLLGVIMDGIGSFFKLIVDSITLPIRLLVNVAIEYNIPVWLVYAGISAITIAIVFAIVSAILKKNI